MKIISYNVNGIRAAITKGFLEWLQQANPDVICLQEIKATEDQIPKLEIEAAGYPYQYYFPAEKKGYSGVAILSKIEPKKVVFGTGIPHMDFEGRNLRVDFEDVSVMSLYLPSGTNTVAKVVLPSWRTFRSSIPERSRARDSNASSTSGKLSNSICKPIPSSTPAWRCCANLSYYLYDL